MFEVRRALEREVVRLVAQRWTPAFAKRLQKIVQAEQSAHDAGDLRASSRLAGDFHTALAEMADNFLLARFMSEAGVALFADPGRACRAGMRTNAPSGSMKTSSAASARAKSTKSWPRWTPTSRKLPARH